MLGVWLKSNDRWPSCNDWLALESERSGYHGRAENERPKQNDRRRIGECDHPCQHSVCDRGAPTGVFGHVLTGDRRARESYLDALEREVEAVAADADDLSIRAIRIDGPMPSIMSPDRLGRLAHGIKGAFCCEPGCETTLVALPHTIGVPSLTGWQGAINRVELLVDSLEPLSSSHSTASSTPYAFKMRCSSSTSFT